MGLVVIRFDRTAAALRELARYERLRVRGYLAIASEMRRRGGLTGAPAKGFVDLEDRLLCLENAAQILTILIPHEVAVRALDPDLAVNDVAGQGAAPVT